MKLPHADKAMTEYVPLGRLETPTRKTPWVRTIWIIDRGQEAPRLVTAYPQAE